MQGWRPIKRQDREEYHIRIRGCATSGSWGSDTESVPWWNQMQILVKKKRRKKPFWIPLIFTTSDVELPMMGRYIAPVTFTDMVLLVLNSSSLDNRVVAVTLSLVINFSVCLHLHWYVYFQQAWNSSNSRTIDEALRLIPWCQIWSQKGT